MKGYATSRLPHQPQAATGRVERKPPVHSIGSAVYLGDALLGQRPTCTDSLEVLANEPKYPVMVLNHVLVRSWGDCRISDLLLSLLKPTWQAPRFNE